MRVKRGVNKKRKHKKVLSQAKGYRLSYHKLYRRAKEALLHAGQYSFHDRRKRSGQFRKLWIKRINAALSSTGLKYSRFIHGLKKTNIDLNRKVLADLAIDHPEVFETVVQEVK
ncbi:50S ribosomal protein L20 [Candidatus Dojkabacteria bacterium]|nr:50S ribosomal protein L20 [Candidatus Dojkabacteria bacterium]